MAAQDLCTLADVKTALEITDTSRDSLISALITQASDAILSDTDREFAPVTASATRRFRIDSFTVNLSPYDLRTAATVTLHPESTAPQTLTAASDYQLLPIGSPSGTFTSLVLANTLAQIGSSDTAFKYGYALLDVNGAWGFSAVPTDVIRAAVITVGAWMRKDVTSILAEVDLAEGLAPAFPSTLEIPRNAKALLGPFYRLPQWVR